MHIIISAIPNATAAIIAIIEFGMFFSLGVVGDVKFSNALLAILIIVIVGTVNLG